MQFDILLTCETVNFCENIHDVKVLNKAVTWYYYRVNRTTLFTS